MMKKKVLFDSSYLNRAKKNPNEMEQQFPNKYCLRLVQDTIIDEFFFDKDGNWYEREENVKFYNNCDFLLIPDFSELLYKEYLKGLTEIKPLCKILVSEILEGKRPKEESIYLESVKQRKKTKKEGWFDIPFSDKENIIIDSSMIYSQFHECVQKEIPLISLLDHEGKRRVIMKGKKLFISSKHELASQEDRLRTFEDIKKEFPTLFNLFIFGIFMGYLMRPKNYMLKGEKDYFSIKLSKDKEHIRIDENTIADFRIALTGLHYIDLFVTCDKSQANIINGLYPEYVDKIVHVPKDVSGVNLKVIERDIKFKLGIE
jgi:hypothetical protein